MDSQSTTPVGRWTSLAPAPGGNDTRGGAGRPSPLAGGPASQRIAAARGRPPQPARRSGQRQLRRRGSAAGCPRTGQREPSSAGGTRGGTRTARPPQQPPGDRAEPEPNGERETTLAARLRVPGLDLKRFQRPRVIVHVATTGPRRRSDRITGVLALRVTPDADALLYRTTVNPGVPIAPDASARHGITDALVAGRPRFATIAPTLLGFLGDSAIEGLDPDFDLQMLDAELYLAGSDVAIGKAALASGVPRISDRERTALKQALRFAWR